MEDKWEKTMTMKENQKGGNDKAPDFKGSFTLEGVGWDFALWPAKSGNGYSGKVSRRLTKEEYQAKPAYEGKVTKDVAGLHDMEDEIPF